MSSLIALTSDKITSLRAVTLYANIHNKERSLLNWWPCLISTDLLQKQFNDNKIDSTLTHAQVEHCFFFLQCPCGCSLVTLTEKAFKNVTMEIY